MKFEQFIFLDKILQGSQEFALVLISKPNSHFSTHFPDYVNFLESVQKLHSNSFLQIIHSYPQSKLNNLN